LLLLEAANYNEVIANDVLPDYRTFYVCYDKKKKNHWDKKDFLKHLFKVEP
jgi:hypothetical protein